jgi:nucleosome binding factor SPN SPT16 subunit
MKLLPEPDKENLKVGCVLVGFGCKYQMYNSFVTRTLLIGKSENYEVTYGKVLQLHKLLISSIEPGKKIKQVYKKAVEYIKAELPDVEVPSNFGSGVIYSTKVDWLGI